MQPTRRQALRTMAGTAAAATAIAARPAAGWASSEDAGRIIERDVAVLGGGSSGTYTAVRLRDLGKSVAVVQVTDRLGGHCETYRHPATGPPTRSAVMAFHGILNLPTVYILKYFGLDVVGSILPNSFLTTPDHDNSRLYENATAFLGQDALLQSTVIAAGRDASGVVLVTDTPSGPVVIKAGKLVITVPPLPGALAPFGLDVTESSLFKKFQHANYYASLLSLPGVPDGLTVQN